MRWTRNMRIRLRKANKSSSSRTNIMPFQAKAYMFIPKGFLNRKPQNKLRDTKSIRIEGACWVYACTKVNPNEFLSLILHFMLLFHSFYYSDSFLWVPIFPYIFLYFIFLYSRIYSRHGTLHLLPLQGYVHAPTFWLEPTTRQVFASACRDSFASTIPTHLHPLDVGLPNTFPCVMAGVETRAAYDLIGKSWPGARYMRSSPRNTVSLSSVLDHHWGGELWSGPLLV